MGGSFSTIQRRSSADSVFEQLAAAILSGELPAERPLPSERELADTLGVSRVVLRQATHRLAELGLLRVRQGGATVVLDPDQATDVRVIGLYYQLDIKPKHRKRFERDVIEKQFLQGLSLVSIVERRASDADRRALVQLCESFDAASASDATFRAFEREFWSLAAACGGNRILKMEVAWWYETLRPAPIEPRSSRAPMTERIGFYLELTRRLARRDSASGYYLAVVTPLLELLFEAP